VLRILGSPKTLCGGLTRRELLHVGGLGIAGLALPDLLRARETAPREGPRPRSFGRAKSIILLHLWGSPSQLETFDPKPDAPVEIRGELKSIASRLPGCRVGELLGRVAGVLDRCTVLRSMTHPWPLHSVYFALTGLPALVKVGFDPPRSRRLWPFIGSIIDYLDAQNRKKTRAARPAVPANVLLPFPFSSQRVGEQPRVGPYAGFLGSDFHPVCAEFSGTATEGLGVTQSFGGESWNGKDPYMGLTPDSHFIVSGTAGRQPAVTLDRQNRRRSLLEQFDQARRDLAGSERGRQLDRYRGMAYEFLQSDRLRTALDVRREPDRMRARYGYTLFGQSCLAARRLIEAGSRIVTVFWDEYGVANTAWDTHFFHYPRLKRVLGPGFDLAWSGLISDLDQRGLLDETLVVCTSEHGRTPRLQNVPGGGRDHWSGVYPSLLAGAGCKRGFVLGASDKHGGQVADRPISPKELLATMYHLLGIDHHTQIRDALGRPFPLVEGQVIREVLA